MRPAGSVYTANGRRAAGYLAAIPSSGRAIKPAGTPTVRVLVMAVLVSLGPANEASVSTTSRAARREKSGLVFIVATERYYETQNDKRRAAVPRGRPQTKTS